MMSIIIFCLLDMGILGMVFLSLWIEDWDLDEAPEWVSRL